MKQFYVGIGGIIEKDNKILVLKRSPKKDVGANFWEFVTGRLEAEEDPKEGILREIKEEVNLDVEIISPINTGFFYRGSKEYPMVFIVFWCAYKSGDVKISWEHSEFKWITIDNAIKNEDLKHLHVYFESLKKIKQYLPIDFRIG